MCVDPRIRFTAIIIVKKRKKEQYWLKTRLVREKKNMDDVFHVLLILYASTYAFEVDASCYYMYA